MIFEDPVKQRISDKIHAGVRLDEAEFQAAWDDATLWGQFSVAFEARRKLASSTTIAVEPTSEPGSTEGQQIKS